MRLTREEEELIHETKALALAAICDRMSVPYRVQKDFIGDIHFVGAHSFSNVALAYDFILAKAIVDGFFFCNGCSCMTPIA